MAVSVLVDVFTPLGGTLFPEVIRRRVYFAHVGGLKVGSHLKPNDRVSTSFSHGRRSDKIHHHLAKMSDYNGSYYEYKVYVTVSDLTSDAVIQVLFSESDDADEEADEVTVEILQGQTTQAVIRHHRDNTPKGGDKHPKLFLVFDSTDLDGRGVLLVSLDEYRGYDDAVRFPAKEARDSITSLCVANDNWLTFRESMLDQKTNAVPVEWFALYDLLPDKTGDFDKALVRMNEGVQLIGVSDDEMDADGVSEDSNGGWGDVDDSDDASEAATGEDEAEESKGQADDETAESEQDDDESHTLYKAAHLDSRDIRHVMDNHASYAQDNRVDPSLFAAIDGEYETEGPLIVRVKPDQDPFRCKGEVAGEILRWIFINFMTWDEAKSFAARSAS